MIKEVFEKEFKSVEKEASPVVIDFYTNWCGPCKQLAPIFEGASKEIKGTKFFKVDLEKNQRLTQKYGISSVPTILILKKGKEVSRINGFSGKERLIQDIQVALR